MAANNVTPAVTPSYGTIVVLWEAMIADSTGLVYEPPQGYYLDSVQAFGTFDTSGTVDMQGSNVPGGAGTFQALLRNANATPDDMVFSAAAVYPNFTPMEFYRPLTTANGGTEAVDVDVYAYFRKRV